ncbi:hypothetical protein GCM10009696_09240 [Kocuria himachalensis]
MPRAIRAAGHLIGASRHGGGTGPARGCCQETGEDWRGGQVVRKGFRAAAAPRCREGARQATADWVGAEQPGGGTGHRGVPRRWRNARRSTTSRSGSTAPRLVVLASGIRWDARRLVGQICARVFPGFGLSRILVLYACP